MRKFHWDYFILSLLAVDFIWLRSSYGKITEGKFVGGLGATLTKFASGNPYPAVKDFLNSVAIPNSYSFGLLTQYGEAFAGLAILAGVAYMLFGGKAAWAKWLVLFGLITGAFLSLVFWFAAGYTSPSTDGLNLLMFVVQVLGVFYLLRPAKG